ncbi:EAL domain-containing protein [Ahrensia sp. R2A130]|uniref:EAL domain-containing protein n=1 Tax=Ahrensia sp. R2A130 TaxID=744979 RepID=UPI0001E0D889|nr:EAL domain-containing protein [Ahrensia sp. R2A130]EFL87926.1 putative diguanylate cyclase [Ahrensia sp. R2A130]
MTHDKDQQQDQLANTVGAMMGVGSWSYDPETEAVQWSSEISAIYGTKPDEPVTLELTLAPFPEDAKAALTTTMERAIAENRRYELILPFDVQGKRKWVRSVGCPECRDGENLQLFGTLEDVTETVLQQRQVERKAYHDPLTGLPNEHGMNRKLKHFIDEQQACDGQPKTQIVCVLELLIAPGTSPNEIDTIQRTFASAIRQRGGFAARFNDGRFMLIIEEPEGVDASEIVLHHITTLSRLRRADGIVMTMQIRCGWLRLDGNRTSTTDITDDLELTLRTARTHAGASVVSYSPALRENEKRRAKVAKQFQDALENGEVVPYYHPIICLDSGKLSGFEAFARWNHPTRGLIAPNLFMQVFDDSAICVRLSHVIMEKIANDMATWHRQGLHFGSVGINVTALDLQQDQFSQRTLALLEDRGLSPRHLMLEVGEAVMLQTPSPEVTDHINRLREAGVLIAIDDYGTHAASLQQLKNVPCDIMKIDRSFIGNMTVSPKDRSIVSALIQMSKDFGYSTVAQGIETREEAAQLAAMGCSRGQGFFYAKPAPAEAVSKTMVTVFDRTTLRQKIEAAPELAPSPSARDRARLISG